MSLLGNEAISSLNSQLKEVKESDFLTLGVFPMTITSIDNKKDKNGDEFLQFMFDTGYTKRDSNEKRYFYHTYHLTGEFSEGKPKIAMLAGFLKRCFGIKTVSEDSLNSIIGKKVAVATKKDANGFISFWYAGSLKDFDELKRNYVRKDESDGISHDEMDNYGAVSDYERMANIQNNMPSNGSSSSEDGSDKDDDLPF